MPLAPDEHEQRLIREGAIPGLLLDGVLALNQFWTVVAAGELGLFGALADGPVELDALALATRSTREGIEVLVESLSGLGYVECQDDVVDLTPFGRRGVPGAEMSDVAAFLKAAATGFQLAPRAIRRAPAGWLMGLEGAERGPAERGYQAAMRWFAAAHGDLVVANVPAPPEARRMLDIGGGHALYSVAFCRRHASLDATVLDTAVGLEATRATVAAHPELADRIVPLAADFLCDDLPRGHDLLLLANIVHGLDHDAAAALVARCAAATEEGAMIVVLDQLAGVPTTPFGRGVAALFGFQLCVAAGGRAHDVSVVERWLLDAGFADVRIVPMRDLPGQTLVVATRTG